MVFNVISIKPFKVNRVDSMCQSAFTKVAMVIMHINGTQHMGEGKGWWVLPFC